MSHVSITLRQSIKALHQKLWEELIGPSMHYHNPVLKTCMKICLSSHGCHFVKNYFFIIIFLHANVQCVYIVETKYQSPPSKAVGGVDWPVYALP